jgi:hypothetical protein
VRRLLVTASVVASSQILVTLTIEETSTTETSVLTRATRCNIPEDTILDLKQITRTNNLHSNAYVYEYVIFLRSVFQLLVTANIPSSPNHVNLMMEAIQPSETSVLIRAIRRNIPMTEFFKCVCNVIF